MQLDQQPPASELVIPDKIIEEQDKGEDQTNNEEEKKNETMDPGKIARLNLGSATSQKQDDDSPRQNDQQSPSYSEFDQDKSPIAAVEIDHNASNSFLNANQNIEDMAKEDKTVPGKDRYAAESND